MDKGCPLTCIDDHPSRIRFFRREVARVRWCCPLLLILVSLAIGFRPQDFAWAQEPVRLVSPQEESGSPPDSAVLEQDQVSEQPTLDELVARLRDTEARLAAIEQNREIMGPTTGLVNGEFVSVIENLEEYHFTEAPTRSSAAASSGSSNSKKWYEKYTLRGYAQFRFNTVLDEAPGSAPAQVVGDSSVGANQSILIRRARLVLSGDVNDHVSIYLQPDFASTPNGSVDAIYFAQIRDWYADIHLDTEKVYRLRVGQSKLPYGWENMQSSSNRLPLDRNDAMNNMARNERDLGAFFYWTPEYAQDIFKYVLDEGLKGSGNYGVFGAGVYNGQGGSLREANDDLHFVSRLTLPFTWSNGQITEFAIQGYTGMSGVYASSISPLGVGPAVQPLGTIETGTNAILDKRVGATFVYYPQPFGLQAEWNVGRGPALNDAQTEVIDRPLQGGYVQVMYRYESPCHGEFWPFLRWNQFEGGYKTERNSPYSKVDEWEWGVEWQLSKYVEIVGMYTVTDRTNTRANGTANTLSYGQFEGQLARFQLQVNY